jgi:hypothetical protein
LAAAAPSAAIADYPRADGWGRGAHIAKASISKGRVTVSCTFHETHNFFAQIYANPSNTDPKSPSRIRWVRTLSLGEHQAGHRHVSFVLGTLAPGNYGIVILPIHATPKKTFVPVPSVAPTTAPTWLLLTVNHNGKVVAVGLHQPA